MRNPPPDVLASWPAPNYINPVERGPALMIVELTLLPIALLCVVLRLFVRIHWLRRSWWDDWLMVAAAVFSTSVTICVVLASQLYGWNIHVWDVKPHQLVRGRQVSIAGQTLFICASALAKLSILVSYLRIAPPKSLFRKLVLGTIALILTCWIIFFVVLWTECMPAAAYWDLLDEERHCIPEGPPILGQTITTVFTDLITVILPMPILSKLNLPCLQRLGLMFLFGMGAVVVVASCMRAYWAHHVVEKTYDVTWEGFYLWIWTAVEANLGVICGCVPSLKPLLFPARSRARHYAEHYGRPVTVGSAKQRKPSAETDVELDADDEQPVLATKTARKVSVQVHSPKEIIVSTANTRPSTMHSVVDGSSPLKSPWNQRSVEVEQVQPPTEWVDMDYATQEQPKPAHWLESQTVDRDMLNRTSNIRMPVDGGNWNQGRNQR